MAKDKGGASPSPIGLGLGHSDVRAEVDVLNGVEELDAFAHRPLEGFAAGD